MRSDRTPTGCVWTLKNVHKSSTCWRGVIVRCSAEGCCAGRRNTRRRVVKAPPPPSMAIRLRPCTRSSTSLLYIEYTPRLVVQALWDKSRRRADESLCCSRLPGFLGSHASTVRYVRQRRCLGPSIFCLTCCPSSTEELPSMVSMQSLAMSLLLGVYLRDT